jgi:transposase
MSTCRKGNDGFTPERKADAVGLVRETGKLAQVARGLELTETSLPNWVKQADMEAGNGSPGSLTTVELAERAFHLPGVCQ